MGAGSGSPSDPTGGAGNAPPVETGGPSIQSDRIFDCRPTDDGASPQRLWRLTGPQYAASVAVLFSGFRSETNTNPKLFFSLATPFSSNGADRFSTYSISGSMADSEFRRALDAAALSASELAQDNHQCIANGAMPTRDCIARYGSRLFRRPLTNEELDHYASLASQAAAQNAGPPGTLVVEAMLMAPQFLYRVEIGKPSGKGLNRLDAFEVATALAFSLTDGPPDQPLYDAAAANQLATSDQIAAHAKRLVAKLGESGTVKRFVQEYFEYPKAAAVFKDGKGIDNGWNPGDLIADTDTLVETVLAENGQKDFLKTLLTTTTGFYGSYTQDNYGGSGAKDRAPARHALPATERAGILTQPTFLTAFSSANDNKPVQRGRFVAESLLCQQIPSLPIGMIPKIPDDPNLSLRDRLAQHAQDPKCAACHHMMDPIGKAFEVYDHYGRYRATDAGRPSDGSGTLAGSGNQDGDFKTPIELAGKLAASSTVEGCFVRHNFRFWLGRNEQEPDACSMRGVLDAYHKNGDFTALLAALFTSDSFFLRRSTGDAP